MKKIYIILSYTGTWLSKAVKIYTKNEFSHVSIALDKDLKYMYSFGRTNVNNPFSGGFVHEMQNKGVYKKFYNTDSFIYSITVNEKQYKRIKKIIKKMCNSKEVYNFNILGLIGAGLNIKITDRHSFYCAEFVKYVLDSAKVDIGLPEVTKPEDFINVKSKEFIYKGKLNKYNPEY